MSEHKQKSRYIVQGHKATNSKKMIDTEDYNLVMFSVYDGV